jgi:cation diffusion facilitator CzcD-associated flavoprotein CzcO
LPGIEGLDRFAGKSFHSQQWDHDNVLAGKRVAVIGTGASAIQFVPHLARQVARLTLFQRTPPWIMPRVDRPVRAFESWLFHHLPFAQRLLRASLFWKLEARAVGFALRPSLMKAAQRAAVRHLHRQVKAPGLRAALTPDYTIGCKRILLSNDYLPALTRENVALVTGKIAYVDSDAIVTDDGTRHPVDCIIYGTGFQAVQPFARGLIRGRGGIDIVDAWRDGAHAYLGSSMPGYPNFFMIAGPNTGLGHNSMVYMIEAQVDYILGALQTLGNEPNIALEVCSGVERAYNARIQRRLSRAVWTAGGCKSWYLDPRSGRNTVLWPGFAFRFRQATRVFRREDYDTHALPGLPLAGRPARMQSGTDAATVEALPTG